LLILELSPRRKFACDDRPEHCTQLRGALDAEPSFEFGLRLRPGLERLLQTPFTGFGVYDYFIHSRTGGSEPFSLLQLVLQSQVVFWWALVLPLSLPFTRLGDWKENNSKTGALPPHRNWVSPVQRVSLARYLRRSRDYIVSCA